ncbi:MAG: HAMP domain-containing protein, partial [Candidatus Electrothrix sp. AR4]|nr:HAMP domain-containing protein [Candidatus Electrothrix sp. AR4]
DYLGNRVLSYWTPLDLFATRWALICEIDETRAMASKTVMMKTRADAEKRVKKWIQAALLLTFLIVGVIAGIIVRSINKPIVRAAKIADTIASGDFQQRLNMRRSDEIGQMANALDRMVDTVAKNFRHKNGMTELSDQMRGELDIQALARNITHFLSKFLGAQMAALYLTDKSGKTLVIRGSYAFNKRKGIDTKIKLGEGIAGQAALEKNIISVTDLPADYVRISSTLGDAVPNNILAVPFVHDNRLTGVIEFASFKEFSDAQMDFLNNVSEGIAIAFRSARSNEEVQALLEETKQQAEELRQQSEELQASNEELESQTAALKEFHQELQSQQEELKGTNADLEEKSEALLAQRNKIKQRNQELIEARKKVEERSKDLALASKYKS